ncbi:MAG: hypothetical protein HZA49_06095 [Planctomycetes bacterium]|nr:hypothetical protein [Planctomycetota bacterium]
MHINRLFIIIGLITFLGLITAWQQIQTIRYGYHISATTKAKEAAISEQKALTLKLTSIKSPQQLLASEAPSKTKMVSPDLLNQNQINNQNGHGVALKPR